MSAPIFAGMAGFADNFTRAYSGEKRRQSDEEERKAEREWRNEQRGQQRQDRQEANQLKTDLKDAGAVRTEQQGTATQGQVGGVMQNTFNQNPEEAQRVKAMMDAEAEMTGAAPATQQQTTAVTGNMARGHQIGQTMGAMGADPNGTEAVAQRTAQAHRQNGQMDKAIQMENAIMDQQAKRLGMNIDQLKFVDMQTNRALESALKSGPTWYEGAAKFVTDAQSGGLKDVKAEHQLSPDGKSVTLFAVMPDGTKQATGTYPADESGKSQFMDKFAALPVEKRMEIMRGKIKSDREDRRLDISERAQQAQERKIDAFILGGGGRGGSGGGGGTSATAPTGTFNMDAIDKTLTPLFAREDPATGAKSLDTNALMTVRTLATRMPAAAAGDATGAAYQAHTMYSSALKNAGGDHAKAMQLIQQAINPPAAPAQTTGATSQQGQQTKPGGAANQGAAPKERPTAKDPNVAAKEMQANAQAHFRQAAGKLQAFSKDPAVQQLRQAHSQALRAGNPMEANNIMRQIDEMKQKHMAQQ